MKGKNLKESQLTNISLTSLTKPVVDNNGDEEIEKFFSNSENDEKQKISNNNRLRSALIDQDRKKVVDNSIKNSNTNISKIKAAKELYDKNKQNIALKEKELEKIKAQLLDMQKEKENTQNKPGKIFESNMTPFNNKPVVTPRTGVNRALPHNNVPQPKKKALQVNFDKNTQAPFQVLFSERGFLINEIRLSFEFIETALSKDLMITLNNGSGFVLDAIKMQKILKYKGRV